MNTLDISATSVMVKLPTGNNAVYTVHPNHLPRADIEDSVNWVIDYGTLVAYQQDGKWFNPIGLVEIDDPKTLALLERTRLSYPEGGLL